MEKGMTTHIVTEAEKQRWVLLPIAEHLAYHLDDCTIGTEPDLHADINLYINYALHQETGGITTALFTHKEEGDLGERWKEVDAKVNWRFTMNGRSLASVSTPASVMSVWPEARFRLDRRFRLGVCARKYRGRKRLDLIERITGIADQVDVSFTGGELASRDMPAWFDSIDALVVLGDNEGGPMPVLEALARHKPVIAPDVGFCWEFPVLRYWDLNGLELIIRGLVRVKNPTNWARTAEHVQSVHRRLLTWAE